jgi:hypothetical protein
MAELNKFNYLNIVAFLVGWIVLCGGEGRGGPDETFLSWITIGQLSRAYEDSPFTPARLIFNLLTQAVLLFEGIFTIIQMMPSYRSSMFVQETVQYWYLGASVSRFFACLGGDNRDVGFLVLVVFRVIFMGISSACFGTVLFKHAQQTKEGVNTVSEELQVENYWMLEFPFNLSFGWFFGLFFITLNGALVSTFGADGMFANVLGILSLMIFVGAGYVMVHMNLLQGMKSNYVVPSVLTFITLGIAVGHHEREAVEFGVVNIIAIVAFLILGVITGYRENLVTYLLTGYRTKENEIESVVDGYHAPSDGKSGEVV